jgi:hypothetical protein
MEWQDIHAPPTHRDNVLIAVSDGRVGIGWFSQMKAGATLNVEYLPERGLAPSLEKHLAPTRIIKWAEITPPEDASDE